MPDAAPPRPDRTVEIVGDIHGRADLLGRLPPVPQGTIRVYVGDIVDRGPDSRMVIETLRAQDRAGRCRVLMGNHEAMMLAFLDDPAGDGLRWLRHGGVETLLSFGISPSGSRAEDWDIAGLADALRRAMGPDMLAWLRARPEFWQSGSLAVVHAGADPALPIDAQPEHALVWGHPAFAKTPRTDGIWVAHGHRIVPEPTAQGGRIAVDTGAYATGRLTWARVTPDGEVSFIAVTDPAGSA